MHSQSPPVAHFDLKPGNIVIDATGCPKLIDFGLSRELARDPTGNPGTKGFKAPEIVAKQAFGLPADVYSYGCVVVCVSTWKKCTIPAEWLETLDPGSELSDVASSCMRRSPTERPSINVIRIRLSELTAK